MKKSPIQKQCEKDFAIGSKWIRVNHQWDQKSIDLPAGTRIKVTVMAHNRYGIEFRFDDYPDVGWSQLAWPTPDSVTYQRTELTVEIQNNGSQPLLTYTRVV